MTSGALRLRVVGLPGSGKTTLARAAAHRLGVPRLELDTVVRLPGGRIATPEAYRAACRAFVARHGDGWVVDGDDIDQVGIRYDEADLVVWVDTRRAVATSRVLRRALLDLLTDARAWHAGRETWGLLAGKGPSADLARWTWSQHGERSARYAALAAADPDRWVRVPTRDARWWLASMLRPRPRRVRVVGSSGVGTSGLARRLAVRLGVGHLEIDAIDHPADWQSARREQVDAAVRGFLDGPGRDGWVVDGDHSSLPAIAALEPDLVVWLDLPNVLRWGWVMQPSQRRRCRAQAADAAVPWLQVRRRGDARRLLRSI